MDVKVKVRESYSLLPFASKVHLNTKLNSNFDFFYNLGFVVMCSHSANKKINATNNAYLLENPSSYDCSTSELLNVIVVKKSTIQ